jgi:hypothetical protein
MAMAIADIDCYFVPLKNKRQEKQILLGYGTPLHVPTKQMEEEHVPDDLPQWIDISKHHHCSLQGVWSLNGQVGAVYGLIKTIGKGGN